MKRNVMFAIVGIVVASVVTGCGSSSSPTSNSTTTSTGASGSSVAASNGAGHGASTTTSGSSSHGSSSHASGSLPAPRGCTAPSDAEVSAAWGVTITDHLEDEDHGCIWKAGDIGTSIQSSYPSDLSGRLGMLHNMSGSTDISIPGASVAFTRDQPIVKAGLVAKVVFVGFPNGAAQVVIAGPANVMTTDKVIAVTELVLGLGS
ncbi:MAG: hypothetical protein JST73_13095 [Actinobacteria bacterium]|nr:hypothetical protein [Actinomycetota bacterium]